MAKNTICLWYDKDAEAAARFYAATFPDSAVGAVHRAPSDYPSGKKGDVLTVDFTVFGIPCLGLNGGPAFKQSEAFSFQIATEDQEETDRYWNAIVGNGLVEHEFVHIFTGCWQGKVEPAADEVEAYSWSPLEAVQIDAADNPGRYTAWFRLYLQDTQIATGVPHATS